MRVSLLIMIATCLGCTQQVGWESAGSGDLAVPGPAEGFYGSKDGKRVFVVLYERDDLPGRVVSNKTGSVSSGGWSGFMACEGHAPWKWEVTPDAMEATFGGQFFRLSDGAVFLMRKDFVLEQLQGSTLGSTNNNTELEYLAELYETHNREQSHRGDRPKAPPQE